MMGRLPAPRREEEENGVKKGPWTPEEDRLLMDHIKKHGLGSWRALPKLAGLNRCGKSCRLRWTNYLRPDIKRGKFTDEEEKVIISMHAALGNKWSAIAGNLPGRTDNEIKNFWNTHLRKKLLKMGLDPVTHRPKTEHLDAMSYLNQLLTAANIITGFTTNTWLNNTPDPTQQSAKLQMLQTMIQILGSSNINTNPVPNIESLLNNNNNNNNNPLGSESILQSLPKDLYEDLGFNNNSNDDNNSNNLSNNVFTPSPHQNQTNFQNFDSPHYQQTGQFSPNGTTDGGIMYHQKHDAVANNSDPTSSSSSPPFSNSLPNLVSASSSSPDECSNASKQMERNDNNVVMMMNPNEFSNPSSSSATFDTWASDFIYGEANDAYWNSLMDGRESNQP